MYKMKLLLICLLTGLFGGHYFAIGRYKKGFLYLFTGGILGLGWMYDIIRIIFSDNFVKLIEQEEQIKAEQKEKINKYRKGFGVIKAAIGLSLIALIVYSRFYRKQED